MNTPSTSPKAGNIIPLVTVKHEARVDSRVLARELDIQHGNFMETVAKYQSEIEAFGLLPFKTEAVKRAGERGTKHHRYALLNEDQAHFVLALSRNTPRVVALKANLVRALRKYRDGVTAAEDYLPFYHALHDEVKTLAERAHEAGSSAPERVFHINVNNLVNRALGLDSGQRGRLSAAQRLAITGAQAVALEALRQAMEGGADHHQAHQRAKQAVERYAGGAGLLIGRAAA